jgi:hypothetical protein
MLRDCLRREGCMSTHLDDQQSGQHGKFSGWEEALAIPPPLTPGTRFSAMPVSDASKRLVRGICCYVDRTMRRWLTTEGHGHWYPEPYRSDSMLQLQTNDWSSCTSNNIAHPSKFFFNGSTMLPEVPITSIDSSTCSISRDQMRAQAVYDVQVVKMPTRMPR